MSQIQNGTDHNGLNLNCAGREKLTTECSAPVSELRFSAEQIRQAIHEDRCIVWPHIPAGAEILWNWDGEIMPCEFIAWRPGTKNGKPTVYAEVLMKKQSHHMMASSGRVFYKGHLNILNIIDFDRTWSVNKPGLTMAAEN